MELLSCLCCGMYGDFLRKEKRKKSVDLSNAIMIFRKWLKIGKNRILKNGDRPTFFKKTIAKMMGLKDNGSNKWRKCGLLYLAYEGLK